MTRSVAMIIGTVLMGALFQAYGANYEVEPNNTLLSAVSIASGQEIKGNIGAVSDVDYFKFVATSTSPVGIVFQRPPDAYVYNVATVSVFDSSSALVASSNIYAPDASTYFDFLASADELYYIEVAGCNTGSRCEYMRSEPYEIVAFGLSNPIFESENNGSLGTADAITPNALVYAQHSTKADLDYFRVDLPGAGNYAVRLTRPTDDYTYNLSNIAILDSSGTLLSSDDVYAPDGFANVYLATTGPKILYLRVTSCDSGSRCDIYYSDPYEIATSFSSAPGSAVGAIDVDGNGGADALTDGLLAIRYLFGFTGTTLTNGAIGPGCSRCTAQAIEHYLSGLMP